MLRESFRAAVAAIRAAGWRAFLVAALSYAPLVAFGSVLGGDLLVVGLVLHVLALVALVRVLGAWRPEALPPLPEVDDQGRRVARPLRPGPPTTEADRSVVAAARNAWRLGRATIRLTGLYLLAQLGAFVIVAALSGGKLGEYSPLVQAATVLPVSALFAAFVTLAMQRIALEGDPRVLVGAAHSVRIARTTYGPLLLLTLVEPAVVVGMAVARGDEKIPDPRAVAVVAGGMLLATVARVLVTAVSNELYLRGARLDLPLVEPPTR